MTSPALAKLDAVRARPAAAVRWMQPIAPIVMLIVVWAAIRATPAPGLGGAGLAVLVALVVFVAAGAGTVASAGRGDRRLHAACTGALLTASAALLWLQPNGAGVAGIFVGLSFVAMLLRNRPRVTAAVIGPVLLAVAISSARNSDPVSGVLNALLVGSFYGMLLFAIRLTDAHRETERLVLELERGRAAVAEAAGLAERQRLAREMHDVLAHSLSGLMLQLEGARMLARRSPDDPRLPEAIERAQQLGRAGLDEARRAIGLLRDDELPTLSDLTAGFTRDHGVPCRFTGTGPERPLTSAVRLAVYRVAQEALTNAARHARPARVSVLLEFQSASVRLVVEDFGDPPAPMTPGVGYGLTGMRERAELLGGTLVAGPTDTGFRVTLDIPA